eukprot:4280974-Alexandrium_andersonii.AAC.1
MLPKGPPPASWAPRPHCRCALTMLGPPSNGPALPPSEVPAPSTAVPLRPARRALRGEPRSQLSAGRRHRDPAAAIAACPN